jgi:hypothetical protein
MVDRLVLLGAEDADVAPVRVHCPHV